MSELPSADQWLSADDCVWIVESVTAGRLVAVSFEELANEAAMKDGTLMMFSYQPTVPLGEPPEPRQYRVIKVERLPGT